MPEHVIHVPFAGREYDIRIGAGHYAQQRCDALAEIVRGRNCLIISDSHVTPLYGGAATALLAAAGATGVASATFPAGEPSKNLHTMSTLYGEAVRAGLDRKSLVVALGGGVAGDMAGFLAATYMRGIDYIQLPTSLVAQVDSAVGGKTGVDLPEGKNLVGAFKQPRAVMIDVSALKTLPPRELSCGLAEVLKYGVILDAEFFAFLEKNVPGLLDVDEAVYMHVVRRSCELKAEVVLADEHDLNGRRAVLNYGHTFGHALEKLAGYGELTHGEAISIGMMMAVELAAKRGGAEPEELCRRQEALLTALGLPVRATEVAPEEVFEAMQTDKKYEHGRSRLLLPARLGTVALVKDVAEREILEAIGGRCDH